MATGGWVADLDRKEHKNWVTVGCALKITKNGIAPKIQKEMEAWYQSLISSPPLQSLPSCTCSPLVPKCASCVTWETELKRHHISPRPKICWNNSDRKQWGSPTGAWEIAKVFMPTLGSRAMDVVNADTTDIGGLLNLLEWCPFIKPPVIRTVLSKARDECRNRWAHAPKQELQDADVITVGHLNSLLNDPVFLADKAAQQASKDTQDLLLQGLVNVRDSEVEALQLLRQSLVFDLAKCQDDLSDVQGKVAQLDAQTKNLKVAQEDLTEVKEQADLNSEEIGNLSAKVSEMETAAQRDKFEVKEQGDLNREEIDKLRKQLETKLREVEENLSNDICKILVAVDGFNIRLNKRDDLKKAISVISDDVEDMRSSMRNVFAELNAVKANLDSSAARNEGGTVSDVDELKIRGYKAQVAICSFHVKHWQFQVKNSESEVALRKEEIDICDSEVRTLQSQSNVNKFILREWYPYPHFSFQWEEIARGDIHRQVEIHENAVAELTAKKLKLATKALEVAHNRLEDSNRELRNATSQFEIATRELKVALASKDP